MGVAPGDRVALMLPTSAEYFGCFLGVLLAGAVPVPIYPPARWDALAEHARRQAAILRDARVKTLVTARAGEAVAALLRASVPGLERVPISEELCAPAGEGSDAEPAVLAPGRLALVQYTSGSTGRPKGVALTHANLLANVRAIGRALALTPSDVIVSWLPLYHDMGLIGAWLASLYHGCRLVVMPPQDFLVRPSRWLRAIHRFGGTVSAAPNFAYEICASRLADSELDGLDLSSWRAALNGAEPVSARTLERFTARFSAHGFRAESLAPVYGLAECSVALTMPRPGVRFRLDVIDRHALQAQGLAKPLAEDDPRVLRLASCGRPIPGHEVRIVKDSGEVLGERAQGRIQFRGPSATAGYLDNPEATSGLFDGEWLETGDLGYFADGELFVTGRVKDLVIRAGRNIHPQDLEEAIGAVEGARKGCIAVFGVSDEVRGTERLVVVAETRLTEQGVRESLRERIRAACEPLLDGHPDDVVLVAPRSIPKTSSGKLRRGACRELYESGRLEEKRAGWPQARFAAALVAAKARSAGRALATGGYALYALAAFCGCRLAGLLWILFEPEVGRRRRAVGRLARGFLRAAGIPVSVTGLEHLATRPCVAAVNHQGYLDALLMTALVPETFFFTPKRDLETDPVARMVLNRLGAQFVDRRDAAGGVADLGPVKARLLGGESAVIYPEGIFYPEPGLRQFFMGGFVAAAETGTPVVPVAIRGARAIWRGETLLPFLRRGSVTVTILPPIRPEGTGWPDAVRLRNETRRQILERCGEFDAYQ